MINLNELAEKVLDYSKKREENGAFKERLTTVSLLKHCAGEIVEAIDAYRIYSVLDWSATAKQEEVKNAFNAFGGELADIIACVLIIAASENIDIENAILKCVEKNKKRAYGEGDKL